jgi:AraC-like DNA-binding protein
MLISSRRVDVPELGARVMRLLVRHPGFVVRLVEFEGGVAEDRLFDGPERRTTLPDWPVLAVTLAGRCLLRHHGGGVLASEGDLVWLPSGAAFRARSGEHGVRALFVQWDPRVFGRTAAQSVDVVRLRRCELESIRGWARRLAAAGYDAERAGVAVAALLAEFRSLGLLDARPAPHELVLAHSGPLVRIGAAVDRALSELHRNPMTPDLGRELGTSPAHTRRLLRQYGEALDLPGAVTWRDLRNLWRLHVGALLMTADGSRTERVAAILGYGSSAAFCHAFAGAGLPSPGHVRRAVEQLA